MIKLNKTDMKVPVKEPIEEILINLYWVDRYSRGSKSFESFQDFEQFLSDNNALAEAINYNGKQKRTDIAKNRN